MLRSLRSELVKFGRPSLLLGTTAMVGFMGFGAYFGIDRAVAGGGPMGGRMLAELRTSQGLVALLGHVDLVVTAIVLITVSANFGAEWSQGTLRNLLVREPRRLRLLAGKTVALLLYALGSAALAIAVGTAVAFVAANDHGLSTTPWTSSDGLSDLLKFAGNGALSIVGYSLLGMFVAVLTRSAPAAVGVSLAYALVVEGLLVSLVPDQAQWLPGQVFTALASSSTTISYWQALAATVAWGAVLLAAGGALFRFRDVTA